MYKSFPRKLFAALSATLLAATGWAQPRLQSATPQKATVRVTDRTTASQGRSAAIVTDLSKPSATNKVRRTPAPGMPTIFGSVTSSANLTTGMYEIPSQQDGEFVKVKMENINNRVDASKGGVRSGNYYYSVSYEEIIPGFGFGSVCSWDIVEDGWIKRWELDADNNLLGSDYAFDSTTGTVYGSLSDGGDAYELCTVVFPKYKSGGISRKVVASLQQPLYAMDFASDGTLYALLADGSFATVDRASGEASVIGASGLTPAGAGSGVIDPTTGRFFATVTTAEGTSGLYELSLTDGKASLVNAFAGNEQVTGLYCLASEAVAAAPGKPTGLAADFPRGALKGTVSFDAPQVDCNGNAAQGELSYTVSCAGTVLAQGTTAYGEHVSAPVTLEAEGTYTISVTVANGAGNSEAASVDVRVGKGLPAAPTDIRGTVTESGITLTWSPVTTSADGGFIDPAEVTYRVTRHPGDVTAENIATSSYADTFERPAKFSVYSYTVEAVYAGRTSAAATSPNIGVGAYETPYSEDFGTNFYNKDLIETFTIIDVNDDGEGWQYNSYTEVMRCRTMGNTGAADDWLILPAIHMEAGTAYQLTAALKDGGEKLPESFEVKYGLQNTVEGMTTSVIENTTILSEDYAPYSVYLNPEVTGDYYIGFHCTTPEPSYYLYLKRVAIEAKVSASIPMPVENLVVKEDPDGAHLAEVSLKSPAHTVSGAELATIDRISLKRDGVEIHSFQAVTPGTVLTYTDNTVEAGMHTWEAEAYNAHGSSDPVMASAFVGLDRPAAPDWVEAAETATLGEVEVTWAAVDTDVNGKPLPAGSVTYNLVRMLSPEEFEIIENGLTGTSHTFTATQPGQQMFVNYAVFAQSEGGISGGRIAPLIIVGTPASLPYTESFADGFNVENPMSVRVMQGNCGWQMFGDYNFEDVKSHDGDNGFAGMTASAEGDQAALITGKIDLSDCVFPVLSFYVYNMLGDWGADDNVITVMVGVDGNFTPVYNKPNSATITPNHWNRVAVDLGAYQGKVIQIAIAATCKHAAYTLIDEVEVRSTFANDLRANGMIAPARTDANAPLTVGVDVENVGMNTVDGAAAVLYVNDIPYQRQELPDLGFSQNTFVRFNTSINPSFGSEVKLNVKVDYDADHNASNDRSEKVTLAVGLPLYPAPTALDSKPAAGQDIELSWTAPDMSLAVAPRHTETFENAQEWTSEVEGWSFVDADELPIGGFDTVTFPGIPEGSLQSFWVMDDRLEDLNNTFAAFSGNRYIASMNTGDYFNDDWAVSPTLCGREHTLTFMAKSYHWMFPNNLEVYYSIEDTDDIAAFELLEEFPSLPWDWKAYAVELPEGTRRVAFRDFSQAVMLFIDDVSFVPEGDAEDLDLLGYNVYCDGILMNEAPVTATTYTAGGYKPSMHQYAVTAVYDKGESAPTNLHKPSGVTAPESAEALRISASRGVITVSGAEGMQLSISRTDGVLIYSATAPAIVNVPAAQGVYIVRADDHVTKVIVR